MKIFSINKEILINAPQEAVFDALTNTKQIVKYYPLKSMTADWQVGGEVRLHGEVNGEAFTDYGVIDELSRPASYQYSYWSDNHGTERTPENHISIRYELSRHGKGTRLIVEQSNIRSEAMFHMMDRSVWDYLLNSLKTYMESRV